MPWLDWKQYAMVRRLDWKQYAYMQEISASTKISICWMKHGFGFSLEQENRNSCFSASTTLVWCG